MGRYQGRQESPLSELGQMQARALGRALAGTGLRRIVSSPLQRCIETARPLGETLHLEIETDPRLTEIAHGVWETRYRDDVQRNDAGRFFAWKNDPERVSFPEGESLLDVLRRWRLFASGFDAATDSLVVTHDVVARLAILEATARAVRDLWQPRVVNGGFAEFVAADGRWRLQEECIDAHLAGIAADVARQAL